MADIGFSGHYLDRPSGLSLPLYRAYSPHHGRWLSRDPIGIVGGANLYGYVLNDPVELIDPNGRVGIAAGLNADAGFCFGLCVGSWAAGAGFYVGTEGFGVYGSVQGGLGVGGHLGAGLQGSWYNSLEAFQGSGIGAEVTVGLGTKIGGGAVVGNNSGAVVSLSGGFGGGLYAGAATSYTWTDGVTWEEGLEALTLMVEHFADGCPQ